jgi:tetratricopeptide (TPR) repeat protein
MMNTRAHGRAGAGGRLLAAALACAAGVWAAGLGTGAFAQGGPAVPEAPAVATPRVQAIDWPATPETVERLLEAEYLTPAERSAKRIFFGRYSPADLAGPELAARAALVRGAYDDPSLRLDEVDALDRAEGALGRGELALALSLVPGTDVSARGSLIRARALALQGKIDQAAALADAVVGRLNDAGVRDPAEAVAAVRLVALRLRLAGSGGGAGAGNAAVDHHALMKALADVRTRIDRLYWPAMLAEAELLYEKDNKPEALDAAQKVLELNPTCAAAWALLGRMTVDSFTFDKTEQVARRLDLLAAPDFDALNPDDEPAGAAPASADGAVILARAMLRQSEGRQALEILEPALTRFANHPELRALACAAEAVRFDLQAADRRLAEMDRDLGPSHLGYLRTGAALAEARQYAASARYLKVAHERAPKDPAPLIEMGLMQVQAGDDRAALDALEKAFALDPFHVRADNSLRLVRELVSYERIETPHFVIRYKADAKDPSGGDAILAREMPAIMERIHRKVAGAADGGIDFEPQSHGHPRTIIDLMPSHAWFAVRIAGMPQIHTIAASTGPVIAMESPRDGPGHSGAYDWERVVRHEYVHTVTLARTSNRIPHWFTEAAAVYLEKAPRDWSTVLLLTGALKGDALFDFTQINIAFVRPKKPRDRQQAYAQGHWMYEFMLERFGAQAPLRLMDEYAKGVREEEAFVSVLGAGREEFMRLFRSWAYGQVRAWGMTPREDQPTLRQLLAAEAIGSSETPEEKKPALRLIEAGALRFDPTKPAAEGTTAKLPDGTEVDLAEVELPEPTPAMIARWLVEHPDHPDVLELAVDEALKGTQNRATPEIVPLLERYAKARPTDPKPHRLLARMYLGLADGGAAGGGETDPERARRAIPHLEFLDQREQRTPLYALELARRHAMIGEHDAAIAKAERATRIDPFDARTRELAATVALQARDLDAAERHLKALASLEPDREIHRQRLEALRKMKATPAP